MVVALGKRKRVGAKAAPASKRAAKEELSSDESDSEDMRDAFRRAFEAKFKPLDGVKKKEEKKAPAPAEEEDDESEDNEWGGISEDEEPGNTVEVIEVAGPSRAERASKNELKAFMSAKPPTNPTKKPSDNSKSAADEDGDAAADALNLKNDLALQRLLKESHLLDASSPNSLSAGPSGKNRHKATDLRIQALGSKASIMAQEKMPMSHRKGIKAKSMAKEDKRRREARENGIILEKERKERKDVGKKRERGVGGPGVGKFSGGTLKLTKRDIMSITGEGRGGSGKKGGKRR